MFNPGTAVKVNVAPATDEVATIDVFALEQIVSVNGVAVPSGIGFTVISYVKTDPGQGTLP
jgi:hypothetical protein